MKELIEKIKAEYEEFAVNAEAQAEKGNKAAGARARKAVLLLKENSSGTDYSRISMYIDSADRCLIVGVRERALPFSRVHRK